MKSEAENALPGYDKQEIEEPIGFFRTLFRLKDITTERAIPAVVVDYDKKNGTVTVLPMAKVEYDTRNGAVSEDRETVTVRVLKICQGGYSISLPIFKGDTGWLIAGDRKCGKAIEKNGEIVIRDLNEGELKDRSESPDDCSILNFSNGFFLPFSWELEDAEKNPNGNYAIRNVRDQIGDKELENEFGVVRDDMDNDVSFTEEPNGKTHSLDGKYHGKYVWSMIELESSGIVNLYGQGKKFSVRKDGLYLDDRPFKLTGGITSIIGEDEEDFKSEQIEGDVSARAESGSGLIIKTKVVEQKTNEHPQKSEMIVDLAGRKEVKFGIKTLKVYNDQGEVETELKFFAEKDLDLPGLLAEDGIEITKTEDGNVLKIKNTGVLQVQQGSNITIDNLGDGKFKINATVPDPPAPPTVNDGMFTVQYNSVTVGTFTANQASNSSATIPLVDKKANTEGIDVTQPNGDNKVKIENTGLTGVHLQQSGAARYLQVTGGTDVQHGGVDVKTKDITITTGVPQSIEEVEATTPIENAIGVSIEQKGSAQNMDLEEIITLTLDADKANCTLEIDGVEATKFFGTEDVDVGTKTISAGEGISVSVSTDGKIITISATGETSGYTGSRVVVVESDYSHPYLRQHKERWEFENGLLKADGVHDLGWSTITQAVEETVNV